jgi:short-subunit dehydrogenase
MTTSTIPAPLAVVTGASSGIGRELARQFVEHGFDVLVSAEDSELAAAADELRRSTAARGAEVRADLADYDGVEQLYQALLVSSPATRAWTTHSAWSG